MRYTESTDLSFMFGSDHFIYDNYEEEGVLHICIKSKKHPCKCPKCGMSSNTLHSTYSRKLQHVPINLQPTILHVRSYKYRCINLFCQQKIFTEQLPFATKSQVRTDALNTMILAIAMYQSNEGASHQLSLMGVTVSNDTIERLYDKIKFKDDTNVEAVGVDDVAIRKGQRYATAIYDMHDHHLIALLNGRSTDTLTTWLRNHTNIKIIARDRANAYASAITKVLPNCIQVADRFHLIQNIITHLQDVGKQNLPDAIYIKDNRILDTSPKVTYQPKYISKDILEHYKYDNSPPIDINGEIIAYNKKNRDLNDKQHVYLQKNRMKKQQLIKDIQEYWAIMPKQKIKLLAEKFNISMYTAKKYINMTPVEIEKLNFPTNYKKRSSIFSPYENMIYKMMRDNCSPLLIFNYVHYKGYNGNDNSLIKYMYRIYDQNFDKAISYFYLYYSIYIPCCDSIKITQYDLLKIILAKKSSTIESISNMEYIDLIYEKYPITKTIHDMFYDFYDALMSGQPNKMDCFVDKYKDSALKNFCESIKKDITPVKNAISYKTISSGFVEGNNNKFKLLKRIVYGRSNLTNLEKKCKLAFLSKTEDFNLKKLLLH